VWTIGSVLTGGVGAQAVTGEIEGWVIDPAADRPLEEVEIAAEGPRAQGSRVVTSDQRGYFRIVSLPPGNYTLRFRLIGRRPLVVERVTAVLGQTTTLGLVRLEPQVVALPDLVVRTGPALIDPSSAALATNFRSEDFSRLPVGRNYRSIIPLAPHATETFLGDAEANIAGSTGLENAYYVDGVNVTDLFEASGSVNLPYNFVQEVQVKTGGYEAEFGRAQGGIVNVITSSGGNVFEGQVFGFLTNDELTTPARLGIRDVGLGEFSQYDVGASLGGPIARDRLWFFAAYNPTFDRRDASVTGSGTLRDRRITHLFAGKLTWHAARQTNLTFTLLGDPSRHDPLVGGTVAAVANPEAVLGRLTEGGTTVSVQGRHLASRRISLTASMSLSSELRSEGPGTRAGAAPRLDDPESGTSSGGYGGHQESRRVRTAAAAGAEFDFAPHTVKLGVEYEDNYARNDACTNTIVRVSDSSFFWSPGCTSGRAHNRIPTIYAQDGWQMTRRLRLNAGLRWEAQYLTGSSGSLAQPITGQLQPRLGVILLPGELGSQRVVASWGRFYEQLPVLLATVYYGEGQQVVVHYPKNPLVTTAGADTTIFPLGSAPRVAGLRGQSYDEVTVGYQRRIKSSLSLGVRGIHRSLRWAIEDGIDSTLQRFLIGNPGVGELSLFPRATRTYDGLELAVERPHDGRFGFLFSYVLSRSRGNYTGLFASDVGQGAPNVTTQFDFAEQVGNGGGLLPNDRTHVLKFNGSYGFDFGLTAGVVFSWQSGTPLSEYGGASGGPPYWRFLRPRGTAGRTPAIWDLNLRYSYRLPAGGLLLLDLFHVGSPRRAVTVDQVHWTAIDESGNQAGPNVNYGKVTAYQAPMSARVGMVMPF
jgi:hypothetical protein